MKIKEITDYTIVFDNGNIISYEHDQEWCEWNYADFAQMDDIARMTEFDEDLDFEEVPEVGFRFGNNDGISVEYI